MVSLKKIIEMKNKTNFQTKTFKYLIIRFLTLSLYLFLPFWGFAQWNIAGKVLDQTTKEPLVGATVVLQNSLKATATNLNGEFRLEKIKTGEYQLQVTYIGFEAQTIKLQVADNQDIEISLIPSNFIAEEVVVMATRATENSGLTFTNIEKKELQKQNLGQDLPILLNFSPSVVTTSDAGAGVGYTGIRIRGSDPTRINVTVNGIPLNDAESQGVFWVNMPDFASSVSSIQIQRGVGTSSNGAGAFGATMNIQTNQYQAEPYAEINNSFGSFNTWKHTLMLGSGLIKGKFTLDGRLSRLKSDGFIDRANSDLKSFFVSAGYYGKKSSVRLNIFSGNEQTYQAWNGVPEARLRGDVAGMNDFILRNGLSEKDAQNLLNSNNRTYNFYTYDNQTDNYQQDHYQFFYNQELNKKWNFNGALHYTRGRGFFEEYRPNDDFETYGLAPLVIGNETISSSDLIRRRWLDNHFYGLVYSFNYQHQRWQMNIGGGWNQYEGKHFGEVIWARFASNAEIRHRYYDNDALKKDFNLYYKVFYQISNPLNLFLDLQYRRVNYSFLGKAVDSFGARDVEQTADLQFFNPKIGLNYQINNRSSAYTSFSVGHREPNRDDFTQSTPASRPRAERLLNLEAGYRLNRQNWAFQGNIYGMFYQNQLILTGQVNDVGAYTRKNVDKSYRVGLELEFKLKLNNQLDWSINSTFSQNKILDYQEFVDRYDVDFNYVGQDIITKNKTDIAFSPNWIGASQLEYKILPDLSVAWLAKYVSRQFLDNSMAENRQLDAYFTNDIRLIYSLQPKFVEQINVSLLLNNVLNEKYESNGYTYGYIYDNQRVIENFYYPQAGFNFLLALGLKF
jgi:iron complex outermembrane receptor protein